MGKIVGKFSQEANGPRLLAMVEGGRAERIVLPVSRDYCLPPL
jgi:hypothetical protein